MALEEWSPGLTRFYAVLGHAISQWAHLEEALFSVYAVANPERVSAAHAAAYHSVTNFNSKLVMAGAAIQIEFRTDEQLKARWEKLAKKLSMKARRRNELAHFQLLIDATGDQTVYRLVSPLGNPKRWLSARPNEGYRLADIEAAAVTFYEGRDDLRDFAGVLQEARRRREEEKRL